MNVSIVRFSRGNAECLWRAFVLLFCLLLPKAVFPQEAATQKREGPPAHIEGRLLKQVEDLGEVQFWVMLREKADLLPARGTRNWKERGRAVHSRLTSTAERSQARVRAMLRSRGIPYKPYWVLNGLLVTGDRKLIEELAAQPEVAEILAERVYSIPPAISAVPVPNPSGVDWNIDRINAPVVWNSYGVRGEGIVVCNLDTGVQFDHPALINSYRGNEGSLTNHNYNWYDPTNSAAPFDPNGHGTHTMGTMVGDGGLDNRIGVAPGARWIAARGCDGSSCDGASLLAAAEWVLAPTDLNGQNPNPDMRPNVVNNSWGGDMWADTWFQEAVRNWIAAGIFPVFSVGNLGAECWTAASPADYPEAYSVGAFDLSDNLGYFSSGGPTLFGGIKPEITAPGLEIRSSVPGNGYAFGTGTSMASPHVAGAVALLWSAAPALKGDVEATRNLLAASAIDMPDLRCGGSATNNNQWGEGKLDASILVSLAPRGPTGSLEGGVTNATDGQPIEGAVIIASGPMSQTAISDTNGLYSFPALVSGAYDITVTAYGYDLQATNGIVVEVGLVSTQHFALEPTLARFDLSGFVTNVPGSLLSGALVTILGTTNPPAVTAADGSYGFTNIPAGTYQVLVEPNCCFDPQVQELDLYETVTNFNFVMAQRSDAFGYACAVVTPKYVEANTILDLSGDDFSLPLTLPFPFTFYGKTYTNAYVGCNGLLTFNPLGAISPYNVAAPNMTYPNAAIYAFWDDLSVAETNKVRTQLSGAAPNRQFVIEWRDVYIRGAYPYQQSLDVQIVLKENGQILLQYRDVPPLALFRGGSATIGIENEDGKVGFTYSTDRAVLPSGQFALSFSLPPMVYVQGYVKNANDQQPVPHATISVTANGRNRQFLTDAKGFYRTQVPVGTPQIEAWANNYESAVATPVLSTANATYIQDFALATARAEVNPGGLAFSVAAGQTKTVSVTITNTGTRELNWSLNPASGYQVAALPSPVRDPNALPNARTTAGSFVGGEVMNWPALQGEVLNSWAVTNMGNPWGLLLSSNVWLTDASRTATNGVDVFEYSRQGVSTGVAIDTVTNAAWVADMTFDTKHGLVCQVNVGGTGPWANCITCWDPLAGRVVTNITGDWATNSQRGIAYRPDTDTFYLGTWEGPQLIREIAGLSYAEPGIIIREWRPVDGAIAGLAWNPVQKVLWQASNSYLDLIYALDPDTGRMLLSLNHPNPGYNGAGLECDSAGNLWVVGQSPGTVYVLNTGVYSFTNVPWLSPAITNGVVPAGQEITIPVIIDASLFNSGSAYTANLFLQTDDARHPVQSFNFNIRAIEGTPTVTSFIPGSPDKMDKTSSWQGMVFTVATNPVSVTALGRMALEGNNQQHTIKLISASDGVDVPGGQVTVDMLGSTAGQFLYSTLPTPIVLEPGQTYYLVSSEEDNGDYWFDDGTQVSLGGIISEVRSCKLLDTGTWSMGIEPGRAFGPVDFKYIAPRVLTVLGSEDWPEAQVAATPADLLGRGVGTVGFERVYDDGTQVALTAAPTAGPLVFKKWQQNGVNISSNRLISLMMHADQEFMPDYGFPLISGSVATPAGVPLANIFINITGDTNDMWLTDNLGVFSGELYAGASFAVSPYKQSDMPYANGVTVADLVLLHRHILGLESISSPLSLLAGDVDGSGTLTVADFVQINRLILGLTNSLPLGLWRFLPDSFVFAQPSSPWSAPTNRVFDALASDAGGSGFTGIRLGDLNFSWAPQNVGLALKHALPQTGSSVGLKVEDTVALLGRATSLAVLTTGFEGINGLQFTLEWDPTELRFLQVHSFGLEDLSMDNFGKEMTSKGKLTFAWETPFAGVTRDDGATLWKIDFAPTAQAVGRSAIIHFSDLPTPREFGKRGSVGIFKATSGVVKVLATQPRLNADLLQDSSGARLSFATEPEVRYQIEFSDSLDNPIWTRVAEILGDGNQHSFPDPAIKTEQRYYRLRVY